jgi:hypothetical protein
MHHLNGGFGLLIILFVVVIGVAFSGGSKE